MDFRHTPWEINISQNKTLNKMNTQRCIIVRQTENTILLISFCEKSGKNIQNRFEVKVMKIDHTDTL